MSSYVHEAQDDSMGGKRFVFFFLPLFFGFFFTVALLRRISPRGASGAKETKQETLKTEETIYRILTL